MIDEELDPNFKWREGAALSALQAAGSWFRPVEQCESELSTAIRTARKAGVPEEGIENVTGLDHAEVDRVAGTVDRPDPGSELANAKVHALAQLEHLRRELTYNYPVSVIRQKRRDANRAITAYCTALDAAARHKTT